MSKIEVNAIEPQCGTTLTAGGGAGKTVVVDATTVTLGRCGGTVALASGASQTGFGRTGTVDWQTGSIKTATFTAANGEGYFCNTTSGTFEVDLPAGVAGAIVSVQDYNNTFDTNNLTIDPNGSEKINGGDAGLALTLSTEGQGLTLVYIDATVGWRSVHSDDFSQVPQNPAFVAATGGTITTVCTDYKVHTFTGPGTFCVSCAGNPSGSVLVDYLVVAGGGGANDNYAGGGGAGGFRESPGTASGCYTASPLGAAPAVALPVSIQGYTITVGAGGGAVPAPSGRGINGSDSIFSTITSAGGGGGGAGGGPAPSSDGPGLSGGSGGGAGGYGPGTRTGGTGNTPSVSPSQGFNGGNVTAPGGGYTSAGGGGATELGDTPAGFNGTGTDGAGGDGATSSINGTPTTRAGGGGGGLYNPSLPSSTINAGGAGGGGPGTKNGPNPLPAASQNGTVNTGGGAGGGGNSAGGYSGGSGIVIIRYKFQ